MTTADTAADARWEQIDRIRALVEQIEARTTNLEANRLPDIAQLRPMRQRAADLLPRMRDGDAEAIAEAREICDELEHNPGDVPLNPPEHNPLTWGRNR